MSTDKSSPGSPKALADGQKSPLSLTEFDSPMDAEIFLGSLDSTGKTLSNFNPFGGEGEKHAVLEHPLGRWKDPLTLPQSRMECVKWASGDWPWGGGWKTCVGHKYQFQWMYVTAVLRIQTASEQNIKSAVENCLTQGAVVGALAGIINAVAGNPGSIQVATGAFVEAVKNCLKNKVSDIVSIQVLTSASWGDWE